MNKKPNTKKIFNIAMADMNDELSLVWKPIEDYVLCHTDYDLSVKFSKNWVMPYSRLTSSLHFWHPVSKTYLDTKEQRQLNKELGLTKTETINNFYKL